MEIIIERDAAAGSVLAARLVARTLHEKPTAVIGLVAGSTPLPLYKELAALRRNHALDFSKATLLLIDEFVGISPEHPSSHATFLKRHLLDFINVHPDRVHGPDGMATDIPGFCRDFEDLIRHAGGIDLQVLGIGPTGHLGFNEPGSSLASRTRIKTLPPLMRREFAPGFGGEARVPHHVITMGLGTLMDTRHCLLLAFGTHKAKPIAHAVEGPVSAMTPASVLQMHPAATVILDRAAASTLKNAAYYRWAYEHKPDWQKF